MSLNGTQMGGSSLRVNFFWSPEPRKEPCSSSNDGSLIATQQYPHSFEDVKGDDHPSNVLGIRYPPSVQIDEEMIFNSLIRYGEIVRCICYPSSHFSLVEFQNVEQARRAKEEQQGMLFGDTRIPITYYSNDVIPPGQGEDTGKRPEMFVNDPPVRHFGGSEYSHVVGNEGSWRRPSPALSTSIPIRQNHDKEGSWWRSSLALSTSLPIRPNHGNEGSWRRPSLALSTSLPIRPFYCSWEGYDPDQLDREPKRTRRDGSVTNTGFPNTNVMWRGIIAKGGTPVCHARCLPFGNGIESELPEIINCSAKTGLDKLATHYAKASGVEIAFFIPDRDEDVGSYTEFISYLDSKNQAGVAKLDDGTTFFLVPPTDFLHGVVKVSGPGRLYGVVLKLLPSRVPAAASYRQESQPIPQSQDRALYDYNRGMQVESLLAPSSEHVGVSNSAMPQSRVSLTAELLATLASLVPKASQPSASESHQSLGLSNEAPSQAWNRDQSLYDYNRGMQEESLLAPSSEHVAVANSAMPHSGVSLPPELVATLASLVPETSQPSASENYRSLRLSNETPSQAWNRDQSTVSDSSNLCFQQLSNQYNTAGQQTPPPVHYLPVSSAPSYSGGLVQGDMQNQVPNSDPSSQEQRELQPLLPGAGQGASDGEVDKTQLSPVTLQYVANLLEQGSRD